MSIEYNTLHKISSKRAGSLMLFELLNSLLEIYENKRSVQKAIRRLKKKKYITFNASTVSITKKGDKFYKKRSAFLKSFISPFKKDSTKNLIVIFDIPEKRKAEREWFRWHLKKFNYEMIQRSVWFGPSPLPKEFLDYVSKIGLKDSIKTFKIAGKK